MERITFIISHLESNFQLLALLLFYTVPIARKHDDPSALRYIMSFSVGHPFVCRNIEFVSLSVEGQSFMLNQIRKMIGNMRNCMNICSRLKYRACNRNN